MSALTRFIASVGALAAAFALSLFPIPAHAQLLWEGQHAWTTEAVTFSSDSKTLISGSGAFLSDTDGTIIMWDVETGAKIDSIAGGVGVNAVALSPDDNILAAGYDDGTVRLWDVATQDIVATLEGHYDKVFAVDFQPPDGTMLVSSSNDGTIRLWDVATESLIATFEGHGDEVTTLDFLYTGYRKF